MHETIRNEGLVLRKGLEAAYKKVGSMMEKTPSGELKSELQALYEELYGLERNAEKVIDLAYDLKRSMEKEEKKVA